MKRASLFALLVALFLVVPAGSQDGESETVLAREVEILKETVARQEAALKAIASYLEAQKGEAATLSRLLLKAEKKGFLFPAPHNDAKKALLEGLQRYAAVAAGKTVAPLED